MRIVEKDVTDAFLSYNELCSLFSLCQLERPQHPVFYDIETTGLSKKNTFLYLIGILYEKDTCWYLKQWFAETPEEEKEILSDFLTEIAAFTYTIQYNGNRFDLPYLQEKCKLYGFEDILSPVPQLDLYQFIKPMKMLLQLDHLRQQDLEQFLQLPSRVFPDGKECIRHYKQYLASHSEEAYSVCLGHNEEDLLRMGNLCQLMNYQILYQNSWELLSAEFSETEILYQLTLPVRLPVSVSGGLPGVYLRAENDQIRLLVHITNGRLRQYYTNFKDYDYLPQEDTAMPKALTTYIDKSLKQAATLETCYTWFSCSEAFIHDPEKQKQYLRHLLPYIIAILSK